MSFWGELRRRNVIKVTVAYLVMVWLLILAVKIIFPFLKLPDYAATLVITLLIIPGLPLAIFLAWAYRITPDGAHVTRESTSATPRSRNVRRLEIGLFVTLLFAVGYLVADRFEPEKQIADPAPALAGGSIRIGVISPTDGSRSRTTGIAHEAAVWLGFEHQGALRIGSTEIEVVPIFTNDEGDGALAVERALELVENEQVIAILGPVNSNATTAVLAALRERNIAIPVISSLSTAPGLTASGLRDPNFFRLSINDADRMAVYAKFMEDQLGRQPNQSFLFLYEDDVYGRGLADSLEQSFWSSSIISRMTWCVAVASPDDSHCDGSRLLSDFYDNIAIGSVFSADLETLLTSREINNVVYLGTYEGAVELARGIAALRGNVTHWFVGNNKDLFDKAPTRSFTIGNPAFDPGTVQDSLIAAFWNDVLGEFERDAALSKSDFVITAYEAGSVLNQALRIVLRDRNTLPSVESLRSELLQQLEKGNFESLEPWRRIKFFGGELETQPDTPVYSIGRTLTREDSQPPKPWVKIEIADSYNYLESPIRVHLQGFGTDSARLQLDRLESGMWEFVRAHDIQFTGRTADFDFHVFRTGIYRVSVTGSATAFAETRISFSQTYILSTFAALFGAWVIVSRDRIRLAARLNRIALGVFAGFVLTFSSLYGNEIAGWFPFPSFGDEPMVNALITGLIGGLVGPYVLAEVFVNWAMILSVRLDRKPEPEQPTSN